MQGPSKTDTTWQQHSCRSPVTTFRRRLPIILELIVIAALLRLQRATGSDIPLTQDLALSSCKGTHSSSFALTALSLLFSYPFTS